MTYRSLEEEDAFVTAVEEELICNEEYCPYHYEHKCSPSFPTCEGSYCDKAWENYCDKHDKEYEK